MNVNRYVNLTMLISSVYVAAVFFLEDQTASLLKDQMPLLWAGGSLTVINVSMLIYLFFRGRALNFSAVLLGLMQLAIFCQLNVQIHDILGTAHYSYSSPPVFSDWINFIRAHALRAADLPDITDVYGISSQNISHQSILAGIALFGMYIIVGIFTLSLIFKMVSWLAQIEPLSAVMKWVVRGGCAAALVMVVMAGWRNNWSLINCCLWPLDNILRTADLGDAFQIFGWQLHTLEPGMNPPATAVFFRMMTAIYAIMLTFPLYSRTLKGGARSVEHLAAICVSPEYSTRDRVLAIKELEEFGTFADSAIPDLVKVLVSSNKILRGAASEALKEIDPLWARSPSACEAIPKLLKLLVNDDRGSRVGAAEVLGEFGPAAERAVPDLIKVLTDSEVLHAAAKTLGKIGPTAIPDLVKILANEDKEVRCAAVQALEKIDPRWQQSEGACREITSFVKDLDKVDGVARTSAVRALGEIGPSAASHLAKLLADSDVQSLAIKALGEIGSVAEQAAVPHLINVLANRDKEVRNLAAQALVKIAPKWRQSESALNAIPFFMKALQDGDAESDDCHVPAEALVEIGPASVRPLVESLVSGNKHVFDTAALALRRIDPRWARTQGAAEAVPCLAEALQNSQWFVRHAAAEVLGKIGPGAIKAVPHLVKAMADSNKKVRSAVKNALDNVLLKKSALMNDEEEETAASDTLKKITRLIKKLTEGHGTVRCEAAEALGEIGPAAEEAIPHLVKALADSDQVLRTQAVQSLGRINSKWQRHESTLNIIPFFVKALAGADVGFACGMPGDALMKIGQEAIRYLVEALADPNKDIANSVAQFLEDFDPQWPQSEGAQEAVPRLSESLKDSQWFVRHAAAEVLGKIGPGAIKAVPYLVRAMADTNKTVRNAAKAALDKVVIK